MAKSVGRPKQGEESKVRTTMFLAPSLIPKLNAIAGDQAKKEKRQVSRAELVNTILEEYVSRYEKKNGEIK